MKRKTSTVPTRIYSYGCFAPTIGADLVERQFSKARGYKNALTSVEHARRQGVRQIQLADPVVGPLLVREEALAVTLAAVRKRIQAAKQAARSNDVAGEADAQLVVQLKSELAATWKACKAAKQTQKAVLTPLYEALDEIAHARVLAARAKTAQVDQYGEGLYWGTYTLVEKAAEQASKTPTGPQFRPWDGRGRIGVQFQKSRTVPGRVQINGAPVADLFAGIDSRMRIAPVPDAAWINNKNASRRLRRTTCQIRIGSVGRAPVWAEFPVILHRPLPADGVVKLAWISRHRVGTKYRYSLQLAIEAAAFDVPLRKGNRTAALDVGYRLRDDTGLRVAYFVDDQGVTKEYALPPDLKAQYEHTYELQSQRDKNFDLVRDNLVGWLAQNQVPRWLSDACAHLDKWKSCKRLAQVVTSWRAQRFAGDDVIFPALEAWRRQDKHLHEWQANEFEKTLARRKDIFRCMSLEIVKACDRLVLEDFDLRDVAEHPEPEEDPDINPTARKQRFQVSISEFRECLKSAAALHGVQIIEVDPQMTTKQCHKCNSIQIWDQAAELAHTCSQCGTKWDQDLNAGVNLLQRERSGVGIKSKT